MATIPTQSEAYRNPQSILQQQFMDFSQQRRNTLEGLTRSIDSVANYLNEQRKTQKELVAKQNATELELFSTVSGFNKFGKDFNMRQEEFWDAKVDQYVAIKNDIEQGINVRENNKKLSQIKTQLENYKVISAQVLAIAKEVKDNIKKEVGSPGAISSLVETSVQELLLKVLDGGDVGLAEYEDGSLYLFDGNATVNLNELTLAETTEQGSYLKYIPEKWEESLDNAAKLVYGDYDKGDFARGMVTLTTTEERVNGKIVTTTTRSIDERQKQAGIDSLKQGNQLDSLLNSFEYMEVLWQDVIPDELYDENGNVIFSKGKYKGTAWRDPVEVPSDQFDTWFAEQKQIAKDYFAAKAVEDYIKKGGMTEGRVTGSSTREPEKPDMNERNALNYYKVFNFTPNGDVVKDLNTALESEEIASASKVVSGKAINQQKLQAYQQQIQSLPQGATKPQPPEKLDPNHLYVSLGNNEYKDLGKKATTKKGAFKQLLKAMGYSDALVNSIVSKYKFN